MMILLFLMVWTDPVFVDRAAAAGLVHTYKNGRTGRWAVPEEVGAGVALFDYDNDGDLDIYLTQADRDPLKAGPGKSGDRLFRNVSGPKGLAFEDVTGTTGIEAFGYGMGVAVADIDLDGRLDLYVTNFGPNQLWRNLGNGRFEDITQKAGLGGDDWSTSACFTDLDGDGLPELYVANYVRYGPNQHKTCRNKAGVPDYCGPNSFPDAADRLYHNRGGGRFSDISSAIASGQGSGLGVIALDLDGDTRRDFYVANDADANFLWHNKGSFKFSDEALISGLAYNHQGVAEAGMGVAAGDVDNDGDEDLIVTHMRGETHTLYQNLGDMIFEDVTTSLGLGSGSLEATGFGVGFLDYDRDGWLDLFVANGTVMTIDGQRAVKDPWPMRQRNQLFRNRGGKGFVDVSTYAGEAFAVMTVSRGAAFGDLDGDGDTDVVVADNDDPVQLLENLYQGPNHWLGVRPCYQAGAHPVEGTRVVVKTREGRELMRVSRRDGSYLAANDPSLLFGLGLEAKIESITITWPDNRRERFSCNRVDTYLALVRGRGEGLP